MCVTYFSPSSRCLLLLLLGTFFLASFQAGLVAGNPTVHNSQDRNSIEGDGGAAVGGGSGAVKTLAEQDEWAEHMGRPRPRRVPGSDTDNEQDDDERPAAGEAAAAGGAQETTNSLHIVNDCVKVSMEEGTFHYTSKGETGQRVCGLYFITDPNKSILITINYVDVQCRHGGLISIVDGWELGGQLFPAPADHERRLGERFHEICGRKKLYSTAAAARFYSSQNAALIQYRIPLFGQGFSVRVQHVVNPKPCNILVQDTEAVYTLQNFGRPVNCSLTTIFPASIQPLYMNVGQAERSYQVIPYHSGYHHYNRHIYHKCGKMGLQDFVQFGGSNGLDTSGMEVIDEFCGYDPSPGSQQPTTIFCGMTTVRLVSSGKYQNKIVVGVQKAGMEDLENANFICDL